VVRGGHMGMKLSLFLQSVHQHFLALAAAGSSEAAHTHISPHKSPLFAPSLFSSASVNVSPLLWAMHGRPPLDSRDVRLIFLMRIVDVRS
jgi:hypothetical protein